MINFLVTNAATIVVATVLAAIVVCIIVKWIKDKKNGKSSCTGQCSSCPMGGKCHDDN